RMCHKILRYVQFWRCPGIIFRENSNPSRLSYTFASESKDKINHRNTIFQARMEFFRKELSNYSFLFQYAVMDIQEEMCKYFLSNLMRGTELRFEKTAKSQCKSEEQSVTSCSNPDGS